MTDLIDHASGLETQFNEVALARQLAASAQAQARSTHGETHCLDCGNEIPLARRESVTNCCTCIGCQQLRERKAN